MEDGACFAMFCACCGTICRKKKRLNGHDLTFFKK